MCVSQELPPWVRIGKFQVLRAIRSLHCYGSARPALNWFPEQAAFLPACLPLSFLPFFFLLLSFLPSFPFSFPLSKFLQWILLCHLLFVPNSPHCCSSASAQGFCLNKQFLKFWFRLHLHFSSQSVIAIMHTDAAKPVVGEKSQSGERLPIAFLSTDVLPKETHICSKKTWML